MTLGIWWSGRVVRRKDIVYYNKVKGNEGFVMESVI